MPRDETALVMVLPEDGADVILAKLRSVGARSVQLLVSEGAVALRRPEVAARINDLALAEGVDVTLISSDQPTIEAARAGGIQTMLVPDARVLAPSRSSRPDLPATPYSTRVIERRRQGTPPRPVAPPPPPAPRDAASDAGLDDLDALPPTRPGSSADEDLSAALAGLSAALDDSGRPQTPADDFFDAGSRGEPYPAPARRMRADEIQLSDEEVARAGRTPARTPRPVLAPAASAAPMPDVVVPAPPAGARRAARRRGRFWPVVALAMLLLLLAAAIGGFLLWNSRVTVAVAAPVRPDTVQPFAAMPVPISAADAPGSVAVVAEPIAANVAVSQVGEVTEVTSTPSTSASGVVNVLNSSTQAILLPAGTEFIAVKADGQEVPFISTQEVLVPGATTADQGAQIVTTRGQAQVPVTARSAGSGSNVEANTIARITPPGGQAFGANSGTLRISHDPLTGGSEQEVRIVKDSDVQALFTPALEALDAEARRQLEALAQARGYTVDASTLMPSRDELQQLRGFDYSVDPPVGTTLGPDSPRFALNVSAAYSALATPPDRPVDRQLGPAVTEQLRQSGGLQPGDCRAPRVSDWRWDGESLLVDGQVIPDTQNPRCQGGLDPAALARVREAVRGKSRAEAEAALQALVAEGLIGSYTLSEADQIPSFDWLITVTGQ